MALRSSGGRLRGLNLAWIGLVALAAACAPPPLPPAEAPSPVALETLRRTEMMFLYPERLDRRMLVGALDALEARFDAVRFDDGGDGAAEGRLHVGDHVAIVPLNGRFDSRRYLQVLGQALRFVDEHLSEQEREDARFDGEDEEPTLEMLALRGALRSLDPYSTIFSGRTTEDFQIRFSGKLSGIGSRIGRRDGHLTAMKVFPKSPAARGGLQDGDWILKIDGDPTQPLSLSEAVDRIRGKAGTRIVLGVQRRDKETKEDERLDVEIVRGEVDVPNVEARLLDGNVGYAEIASVSRTTASEFRQKVIDLGEIQGLVLDLRSNSGGSMLAAQQLADMFLSQQLIVRVVGRQGRPTGPQNRAIANRRVVFDLPVVILVSGATASAAEILSGALAPLGSVTIVGQKTFGKGVIQQVLPLPEENLLKLTVAEYLLSEDRAVHGRGIVPDIELAPVPDKRLGRLGSIENGAIAYVREAGENDEFPIEVARLLLTQPRAAALQQIGELANQGLREALAEHGVAWEAPVGLPAELPRQLGVRLEHGPLAAGEKARLDLVVHNPNPFVVPAAWAVLEASAAEYLSNRIAVLGDIPAGGEARASLEVEPPAGVSADQHPLTVHVASGNRTLQAAERVLSVVGQAPVVAIDVTRAAGEDGDMLEVVIRNTGTHPTGALLVAVPGANRSIEQLAPGAEERVELALSANPASVNVTLSGPWVRRRVEIPIPDQTVHVSLPDVRIARARRFGGDQLRVDVADPQGLHEGWIRLGRVEDDEEEERDEDRPRSPDQKVAYADWAGRPSGQIVAALAGGEQNLTVKIETAAGISVWDMRLLAAQ